VNKPRAVYSSVSEILGLRLRLRLLSSRVTAEEDSLNKEMKVGHHAEEKEEDDQTLKC